MGQHSSSWPCGCGRTMKSFLQGSTWLLPGQPGAKSRRQVNQAVCCVVSSGAASPLPRPWDLLVLLLCQLCPSHTRATPRHCLMAWLHPPSWCPHFRAQSRKSDCSQKRRAPLPILKNRETLLKKKILISGFSRKRSLQKNIWRPLPSFWNTWRGQRHPLGEHVPVAPHSPPHCLSHHRNDFSVLSP